MIVGKLAGAIEKVLEANKEYQTMRDKILNAPYWPNEVNEEQEYFDLEDAEKELVQVIKQMASGENE